MWHQSEKNFSIAIEIKHDESQDVKFGEKIIFLLYNEHVKTKEIIFKRPI